MNPTLGSPELLLVDRTAYRNTGPRRGEVVVARHFGEWITKRIVGLPGETVAVREGRLLIAGALVPETYQVAPGLLEIEPGTLQGDRYALLGDNRNPVISQNVHAVVARDQILGRVAGSLRLGRRATTAVTNGEEAAAGPDGAGEQNPASGRPGT